METTIITILAMILVFELNKQLIVENLVLRQQLAVMKQSIVCPWDTAPKYLFRDRDAIYGHVFRNRVKNMGINEVISAPRSPWQNPYVERLVGSIRRDCLNHVIILNKEHLKRILTE